MSAARRTADPKAASAATSASLLAPTVLDFHHPQADRRIALGLLDVHYRLQRVRRRSIGMVIGPEGLEVRAPRWVSLGEIEAALREKAPWIERRLHEQRERGVRLARARIEWREGAELPFLGEPLRVVLDPRSQARANLVQGEDDGERRLVLSLPTDAPPAAIRDAVQLWLKHEARLIFEARAASFAAHLGVAVKQLTLSSAETRWGSASADGRVRLNWRLVHLSLAVIDYVVVHELAHLHVMDHSPRFWAIVRSVLPDFETQKAALRDPALPIWE